MNLIMVNDDRRGRCRGKESLHSAEPSAERGSSKILVAEIEGESGNSEEPLINSDHNLSEMSPALHVLKSFPGLSELKDSINDRL